MLKKSNRYRRLLLALMIIFDHVTCCRSSRPCWQLSGLGRHPPAVSDIYKRLIRTVSWEQGTASDAITELEFPEYSAYGCDNTSMVPYSYPAPAYAHKRIPLQVIQFGLSAAVRQSPDGRLSQQINDGLDGAALDGASSGSAVLIGEPWCQSTAWN